MGFPPGTQSDSDSSASTSFAAEHFSAEDVEAVSSGQSQVERLKEKVAARLKQEEETGVKRALLESVMRLKTTSGRWSNAPPCSAAHPLPKTGPILLRGKPLGPWDTLGLVDSVDADLRSPSTSPHIRPTRKTVSGISHQQSGLHC